MPIKPLKYNMKAGYDPMTDHGRFVLQLVRNSDFANATPDVNHFSRKGRCFALRPKEVIDRVSGWQGRNDPALLRAVNGKRQVRCN
jgi:hypothetical protein